MTFEDAIERGLRCGLAAGFCAAANRQAQKAAEHSATAEGREDIIIRSGEAAIAARLAQMLSEIAEACEAHHG